MARTQATVTRKGQVTIPVRLRKKLGVKDGGKVDFQENGDDISLRRTDIRAALEKYRGSVDFGIGKGRKAVIDYVRDLRDGDE